jgi:hypothetical protein
MAEFLWIARPNLRPVSAAQDAPLLLIFGTSLLTAFVRAHSGALRDAGAEIERALAERLAGIRPHRNEAACKESITRPGRPGHTFRPRARPPPGRAGPTASKPLISGVMPGASMVLSLPFIAQQRDGFVGAHRSQSLCPIRCSMARSKRSPSRSIASVRCIQARRALDKVRTPGRATTRDPVPPWRLSCLLAASFAPTAIIPACLAAILLFSAIKTWRHG